MTRKNKPRAEHKRSAAPMYEGRTRYEVTPEEFALTWNASDSAEEVAEKLGMPEPIVLARVSNYRKRGVNLKKMRRKNARRVDVEAINKSIETTNTFLDDHSASPLVERVLVLANDMVTTPPLRGLSVRIHLLDGTPDGPRIFERISSTIQALACSRPRFRDVKSRPELKRPGAYLLIGPPAEDGRQPVYVGEGDPVFPRLEQHSCKKDFWTGLLLFSAKNDCLHKAHIQYLESRLTSLAKTSMKCKLYNGNTPELPSLSAPDVAEGQAFLDEALLLSRLLGLSFFEPASNDPLLG